MSRRWQHIVTDYGVEGWIPDPHRWDTAIVLGVLAAVLILGLGFGFVLGAEYTLGWIQ